MITSRAFRPTAVSLSQKKPKVGIDPKQEFWPQCWNFGPSVGILSNFLLLPEIDNCFTLANAGQCPVWKLAHFPFFVGSPFFLTCFVGFFCLFFSLFFLVIRCPVFIGAWARFVLVLGLSIFSCSTSPNAGRRVSGSPGCRR